MSDSSQEFGDRPKATGRLRGTMRLAKAERERLWKGLERFVNCGDSLEDFQALSRAFPGFWPAPIENHDEKLVELWNEETQQVVRGREGLPPGEYLSRSPSLAWHPACHRLLLFCRDLLRGVWKGEHFPVSGWEGAAEEFLLGLINYNSQVIDLLILRTSEDQRGKESRILMISRDAAHPGQFLLTKRKGDGSLSAERLDPLIDSYKEAIDRALISENSEKQKPNEPRILVLLPDEERPGKFFLATENPDGSLSAERLDPLEAIWCEILAQFPDVRADTSTSISLDWKSGEFRVATYSDFATAFFLVFSQNWRARICPRCKMFFIARKPKQRFCGTACSGGSRLESKRKWWNRVGAKRRNREGKLVAGRIRKEGKPK